MSVSDRPTPLPADPSSIDALDDEPTRMDDVSPLANDRTQTSEPPGSTYNLRVTAGPDAGRLFPLAEGETAIGRSLENTLVLSDLAASRFHAVVLRLQGGLTLRDLGSGNGTLVNGTKVREHALCPNDEIKIGETTLRVEDGSPAPVLLPPSVSGELDVTAPPQPRPDLSKLAPPIRIGRGHEGEIAVLQTVPPLAPSAGVASVGAPIFAPAPAAKRLSPGRSAAIAALLVLPWVAIGVGLFVFFGPGAVDERATTDVRPQPPAAKPPQPDARAEAPPLVDAGLAHLAIIDSPPAIPSAVPSSPNKASKAKSDARGRQAEPRRPATTAPSVEARLVNLYKQGNFTAAIQIARNASASSAEVDARNYDRLADNIARFAAVYPRVSQAGGDLSGVARDMQTAITLDEAISSGHYAATLRPKLAGYYFSQGRSQFGRQNEVVGCSMIQRASTLDPSLSGLESARVQCGTSADGILIEAASQESSNPARAKELYRQVTLMLPSSSASYRRAYQRLNALAHASSSDEDE